jgi:hypothetical protein
MKARTSRKADRILLIELAKALNVSRRRIKRDTCSDPNIFAIRGHISTDSTSFYLYVQVKTPRRWEITKRALNFLSVTQDGDDEGIFILHEMPTTQQAAVIRKVLGLRKAPSLKKEEREAIALRLRSRSKNRPD